MSMIGLLKIVRVAGRVLIAGSVLLVATPSRAQERSAASAPEADRLQRAMMLQHNPVWTLSRPMDFDAPRPVGTIKVRPSEVSSRPLLASPEPPVSPVNLPKTVRTVIIRMDSAEPPLPQPPAGKQVYVQLSAQRTEEDVRAAFSTLQGKYPDVLGSYQLVVNRADLGDRGTYYRGRVGPFETVKQARDLCDRLKAAGGQCVLQWH